MYLLDTNVVSELRKIPSRKANQGVVDWYNSVEKDALFLNTIVVLEQRKWVVSKRRKDKLQGEILQHWLDYILQSFDGKILPITTEIALICAELHVPDGREKHDALIASTALYHDLTVVTRNLKDFKNIDGLKILNPFC